MFRSELFTFLSGGYTKDTVVHRSFSVGLGGGRFRAGQAANMLHMSMKAGKLLILLKMQMYGDQQ